MVEPTKATPITAWPPRKLSGKPGFSSGHFAALAGAEEDPLRVAERIAARRDGERIGEEARARLERGDDFGDVRDWQSREMTDAGARRWEALCASFDEVIKVLESVEQTPAIRRLVREAKRAQR
jgi:hypothetical protein